MFAEQSKAESEEKKENSAFHQTGAQNKSRHYAWWNPFLLVGIGTDSVLRKFISPMKRPCCRFLPTCSEYALDAF